VEKVNEAENTNSQPTHSNSNKVKVESKVQYVVEKVNEVENTNFQHDDFLWNYRKAIPP
jgi:uncharacterized Zn finger protein